MKQTHTNNFDILRFLAAIIVLYSHVYSFAKSHDPLYALTNSIGFGELGVAVFFVISGYLITMSWQRNNNILVFLINRTLRIFPALLVVVAFAIFIVGPLFSELSIKEYFVNKLFHISQIFLCLNFKIIYREFLLRVTLLTK
jgi:peptidoglycan/LPS O-acetylase OafA/YrhL